MKHSRITLSLAALAFIFFVGASTGVYAQTQTATPAANPLPENLQVIDPTSIANLTELLHLEVAPAEEGSVNQIAWSPDSKTLAIFGNSAAWFYDLASGTLTKAFDSRTSMRLVVGASIYNADGWRMAVTSDEGSLKVLNALDGKTLQSFEGHTLPVWGIAYDPTGHLAGSVGKDGSVRLWDWGTGTLKLMVEPLAGESNSVQFSPDGKILATGHQDQKVRLWDVTTGDSLATLSGHTGTVWTLAFSPDGTLLASDGVDTNTLIWDLSTDKIVTIMCCHTGGPVVTLAFSPDGQLLAAGGIPNSLKVWSVATGDPLRDMSSNRDRVQGVQFSPDGKLLASASWDGTVSLWGVIASE